MIEKSSCKTKISDKKAIQKKRIIKYFINAVIQIQEKEGLDAVTIRKVADIAGYNSATLYNYFENLDSLLFFASMEYFKEYINELPGKLEGEADSLKRYRIIWECFLKHSFNYPHNYYSIFFVKSESRPNEYLREYYTLFPLDTSGMSDDIKNMMTCEDLFSRGNIAINECVKQGYFKEEEGYELNDVITYIYESFLYRVINRDLDSDIAYEKINKYLSNMIEKYRIK
ncbi:MAG: TetR/AcrR family transcriptional regulator [Proteocatella sp.]